MGDRCPSAVRALRRRSVLTVMSLVLMLAACGGEDDTGSDAATDAEDGGGGEAATGESFTLSIGGPHAPEGAPWVALLRDQFIPQVVDRVAAETLHEIDFTEAWAGTIAGADEVSESVETGILDMGYVTVPAEQGRFPLHTFNYWLPFGPSDPVVAYEATRRVYEDFAVLRDSFEEFNQRYLSFDLIQNYGLVSTFPLASPDDVAGERVGGIGPNLDYIEAAGGTGVTAAIPDMYSNIETGVMSGMIILPASAVGQSLWEVATYWTSADFGALAPHILTINLDSWDALPEDVRVIIEEEADAWGLATAEQAASAYEADVEAWASAGGEVAELPREQQEAWAALLPEDYVLQQAQRVGGGLPAVELIQAYIAALEELGYVPVRDWLLE